MGLFDKFVDDVAESAIKSQAKTLVASWVGAGYIEASKSAELQAGIIDLVEVAFGMIDKGQRAQPAS